MLQRQLHRASFVSICLLFFALVLTGCDDDDNTGPGDFNSDRLEIVPSEAAVPAGGQIDFDAMAGGEQVGSAMWSIEGANSAGSITQDGIYSAPDEVSAQFTLTIRAVVPTLYPEGATATLTVTPGAE